MRARERSRVGKGAPPAFRRGRSVTRFSQLYALLLCTFALLPLAGKAQELPPRAIRIIVPSPPGAAGDISARLIGQKLSESLRQPVVVENQAGASGAIGSDDGREIACALDELRQAGRLGRDRDGRYHLVRSQPGVTHIVGSLYRDPNEGT